jgi:hypothetical protein
MLSCHSSLVASGVEVGNKNERTDLTCMTQNIKILDVLKYCVKY